MTLRVPKRLNEKQSHSHRRAPKQEKETADRLGGRVTPRSGAGGFQKGDVRVESVLRLDNKTTKNRSFSVTADMLSKLEAQAAMGGGEVPVFEVEIDNLGTPQRCYVIPTWALDGLINQLAEKNA